MTWEIAFLIFAGIVAAAFVSAIAGLALFNIGETIAAWLGRA